MKLMQLLVIAILAGTLGVIGCSSDNGGGGGSGTAGTGGNGGTGGSTTDACTGPLCADPAPKEACNELIGECNTTVEVDIPEETCDLIGNQVFCEEGAGGNGGNGGTGGVPADLGCNVLGCVNDGDLKTKCEEAVDWCLAYCAGDAECQEDECLALGLLICNVTGG